ncbi:MAG: bacterial proteasome activator family protein [Nocardioides sp.]
MSTPADQPGAAQSDQTEPDPTEPEPTEPDPADATAGQPEEGHTVFIIGPDGQPVAAQVVRGPASEESEGGRDITDLVEQPAKVMRIGSMIRQLLEEVKSAPLDEASRSRLKEIHQASIKELEAGLAPELIEELDRLTLPFTEDGIPSESELRIAQAQLVGWLEGVFHGIQTAIYAQQMAARAQLEQMRRSLPSGMGPGQGMSPGGRPGQPGMPGQSGPDEGERSPGGGMYL